MFIDGAMAAMESLGDEAWKYANKEGSKIRKLKQTWLDLKQDLGYERRWSSISCSLARHPQRHASRVRLAQSKRKQYTKATTFSAEEDRILQEIYEESPHLYFDEIQTAMRRKFGKQWHVPKLW